MSYNVDAQVFETQIVVTNTTQPAGVTSGSIINKGSLSTLDTYVTGHTVINDVKITPNKNDIIYEQQAVLNNNQNSYADITDFTFDDSLCNSFKAIINVTVSAGQSKLAVWEINGLYKPDGWVITSSFTGDLTGVQFSIANKEGGIAQIQYVNENTSGTTTIRYRATTTAPPGSTPLGITSGVITNTSGPFIANNLVYASSTDTLATTDLTFNSNIFKVGGLSRIVGENASQFVSFSNGGAITSMGDASVAKNMIVGEKIGIANTAPTYQIDVTGDINFTGSLFKNGSLYSGSEIWSTGSGSKVFYTAGNIGLGTTDPAHQLDVLGGIKSSAGITTTTLVSTAVTSGSVASTNVVATNSTISNVLATNSTVGTLGFTNASGTNITASTLEVTGNAKVAGPAFQIPSGNIAARPAAPVSGQIRYNSETNQFEGYGPGNAWGSLGGVIDIAQTTKVLASGSPSTTDGNLYFFTVDSERMRINSSGNVGVGTTSPGALLDVNGSAVIRNSLTTGSVWSTNATITNIMGTSVTATNLVGSNATFTTGTVGTLISANANLTTGTVGTLVATNANVTTGTVGTLVASSATVTNANVTTETVGTLLATNANVTTGTVGTLVSSSATVTNANVTTGTVGTLVSSNASVTTGTVGTLVSSNASVTTGTVGTLVAGTATVTTANLVTATVGTLLSANANMTTGTVGTLLATNVNATNETVGSLVATNATITNSTISNIVATSYSGSNLRLSGDLVIGGTLTTVNITATNISETNVSAGTVTATSVVTSGLTTGSLKITGTSSLQNVTSTNISTNNVIASNVTLGNFYATSGTIGGNLIPSSDVTYSLGSPSNKWKDIYLASGTIYLGDKQLSLTGDSFTLEKISVTSTSNSTSAITGALTVAGGVGVSGGIFASSLNASTGSFTTGTVGTLVSSTATVTNASVTTGTVGTLVSSNANVTTGTVGTLLSTNANVTTGTVGTLVSTNANVTTETVGTSRITTSLLALGNSNTVGSIFTTGGNVGIATTAPRTNVEITQSSSTTGVMLYSGLDDGGVNSLMFNHSSFVGQANSYRKVMLQSQALGTGNFGRAHFGILVNTTGDFSNASLTDAKIFVHGSSGLVGIATTAPSTTLDVAGTARVSSSLSAGTVVATTYTGGSVNTTNVSATNVTVSSLVGTNVSATNVTVSSLVGTTVSAGTAVATTYTGGSLSLSGDVKFNTGSVGALRFTGSDTTSFFPGHILAFDSAGVIGGSIIIKSNSTPASTLIGINNSNPSYMLDVNGTARIVTSLTTGAVNATNITGTNIVGTAVSSGTLNFSTAIASTGITAATLLATTSISTGIVNATNVSATSVTATSLVGTTVSAGTAVATTYTGGSMSLSGNLTLAGTLTTVNITTTNVVDTNISAGTLTATNINATTETVGTSRITTSLLAVGNSNTVGSIFTTGGNVGINTTSPSAPLHITGTTGAVSSTLPGIFMGTHTDNHTFIQLNSTTGNYIDFSDVTNDQLGRIYYSSTTNNMDFYTNSIVRARISSTGDLTMTGDITAFGSISDRRFKENIQNITTDLALEKVKALRPVTFTWNDSVSYEPKRGTTDAGFIAQEVEEVVEYAVDDFQEIISGETYKKLKHERIIPYLVGAIQALEQKVADLESRLS